MEAAAKNALFVISHEHVIKKLHFRPKQRMAQLPTTCSKFGKSNHTVRDCKFKDACVWEARTYCSSLQIQISQPKPTGLNQPVKSQHTNTVQTNETTKTDSESEEFYNLKLTTPAATSPIEVSVEIEGKTLSMEVDTGAAVSIISEVTRKAKTQEK